MDQNDTTGLLGTECSTMMSWRWCARNERERKKERKKERNSGGSDKSNNSVLLRTNAETACADTHTCSKALANCGRHVTGHTTIYNIFGVLSETFKYLEPASEKPNGL